MHLAERVNLIARPALMQLRARSAPTPSTPTTEIAFPNARSVSLAVGQELEAVCARQKHHK